MPSSNRAIPTSTLVVDNGAYSIKAGFASQSPDSTTDCQIIPNCIAKGRDKRVWIGAQLHKCRDFGEMAFRRPVEKGYLVNWEAEKEIWDSSFFDNDAKLKCDPHETALILAEAPNTPQALQTNSDQMVFEEFEFASYYRCVGASLNAYNDIPAILNPQSLPSPSANQPSVVAPYECLLVIDSSYSHTTITPVFRGRPIHPSIRRLPIGGKFVTNYLKELISLRHYSLIDEPHLVNEIKEDTCFVTQQFRNDLERTWKGSRRKEDDDQSVVVDYVLPTYTGTNIRGFARPHDSSKSIVKAKVIGTSAEQEDVIPLGNERFTVPELLFNPRNLGMQVAGLPEAVMQVLDSLPEGLRPPMCANVLIVGGCSSIPGFLERLETELRMKLPTEYTLRIARAPDPIRSTWLGGARFAADVQNMRRAAVTRQEYLENGAAWTARQFAPGSRQ